MRRLLLIFCGVLFSGASVISAWDISLFSETYPKGQEPCVYAKVLTMDEPSEFILPFWNCPEEIQVTVQNFNYLMVVFSLYFISTAGEGPSTAAEVENSPYNPIPFSELRNPYFNRPIQYTETPTEGDFTFRVVKKPGEFPRLHVEVWFKDPNPEYPDRLIALRYGDSYDDFARKVDEYQGNRKLFQSGLDMDKKVYALNFVLHQVGGVASMKLLNHPAREWEEFFQTYYWAEKLKNPYTGAPVQNVSHKVASPGDCTYFWQKIYWDSEAKELREFPKEYYYTLKYSKGLRPYVFCYNDQHKPVGSYGYHFDSYLESNRILTKVGLGVLLYIP